MHKRKLHHLLVAMRKFPFWLFIVAGLLSLVVAVFALRSNNQRMIELRDAVFAADEQGAEIEVLEGALRALREHVHAHMNTDLAAGANAIRPPIQLKYHYERLVLQERARLGGGGSSVYTDAQEHCERENPTGFSGSNRLDCIREYVDSRGAAVQDVHVPEDLYKFDFASPRWSPDLAGISLLLGFLLVILGVLLGLSELHIKRQLKKHE